MPRTTAILVFWILPGLGYAQTLPGTSPWDDRVDTKAAAAAMVEGLHHYLDDLTAASPARRESNWPRGAGSLDAYAEAMQPRRERLASLLGVVDPRSDRVEVRPIHAIGASEIVGKGPGFQVVAVQWDVYEDVCAEGLMLVPEGGAPRATVVVVPNAASTPEQMAGLAPGLPPGSQVARWLAQSGCQVLIPAILDRTSEFSRSPTVRPTNLSHREWIWRMGFETGRSPIGYEVDMVRAVADWLDREDTSDRPLGVVGHGEGGRVALYAAALDPRFKAVWIAGAFGPREGTWAEPIDRGLFGLLDEFGDAEVAGLIAPRALLIDATPAPVVDGPPPPVNGRADAASGQIEPTPPDLIRAEVDRLRSLFEVNGLSLPSDRLVSLEPTEGEPGVSVQEGLPAFLGMLGVSPGSRQDGSVEVVSPLPDPRARQERLVRALSDHTQRLLRTSELRRFALWKQADLSSPEAYARSVEPLREQFWTQVIGKFPPASEPMKPRSVQVYDTPAYAGYAVEIPVWPKVVASGILLLPKDLKEGEKRPVVVCQHGLEGTPDEVTNPEIDSPYHGYGAKLAERGFIVYAPQNPYIGHDRFRQLQRKAHPLGKSLFGLIVRQHERTLEWLNSLPQVDGDRIAFYGLSYGGKSAMRLPALLPGYCLSICSADFNEWVVKCTNLDRSYSYMFTVEYDMYEWDLAGGFNYAEMAGLIAPRPFQVERGHDDGVAPDEWIGYEFAKVKERYDRLGLADQVDITYFNGPHEIHGVGTFNFLAKHLQWPRARVLPEDHTR